MGIYSIIWLIILLGMTVAELLTMNLVAIWFIPAALVSLLLSLFNVNVLIQVIVFVVISVGLLIATRPLVRRFLAVKKDKKTNADAVIDAEGYVTRTINNVTGQGEARVNGMIWTARSDDDAVTIDEGSKIIVLKIEGVKIICRKI